MPAAACVIVTSQCLKCCLLSNAAQPIFSARNEAIGWEEAYTYDILRSQHKYSCCNSPPVKPRAGEVFLFSATEASKRSSLQYLKCCQSKQRSYIATSMHACMRVVIDCPA